jgi:hypothetical protein
MFLISSCEYRNPESKLGSSFIITSIDLALKIGFMIVPFFADVIIPNCSRILKITCLTFDAVSGDIVNNSG